MEVQEIMQVVRKRKLRPPKHMEKPNLLYALVYWADCGNHLVLCRTEKTGRSSIISGVPPAGGEENGLLSQLDSKGSKGHVLDDLRRATHFAQIKERQLAKYTNRWKLLQGMSFFFGLKPPAVQNGFAPPG